MTTKTTTKTEAIVVRVTSYDKKRFDACKLSLEKETGISDISQSQMVVMLLNKYLEKMK